jgi:hypothetical protein
MPRVGFGPTIPGFERAKTIHALDLAATVTGMRLVDYQADFASSSYVKWGTYLMPNAQRFIYLCQMGHVFNVECTTKQNGYERERSRSY